ncbi:MAG TPA: formate dehydrogenase accessory sulfurtransferase FdhD [Chloroflexota bacterium]|nr:formate dehydrogenase accessory sulfurtransferase FdhD [Chloroflexota bacterium]
MDHLAVEEPLEIRLAGYRVAVTMRTPGHDFDLATGFLLTEGIISSPADVAAVAYCSDPDQDPAADGNIVNVNPRDPATVDPSRWQRHSFISSSCGICGRAALESVRAQAAPVSAGFSVRPTVLAGLGEALSREQAVFARTGGLHAAALFDPDGVLEVVREDVGRHNAVDKVVGARIVGSGLDCEDSILMVSGRASFEVVQKALMARIAVVVAVSAPSSLAVELARGSNLTLVGFLRDHRFNVYAAPQRIRM